MHELFDSFRRTMTAADARVLGSRCQADEAIGHFARVAFYGKFGVAGAEDDSASIVKER